MFIHTYKHTTKYYSIRPIANDLQGQFPEAHSVHPLGTLGTMKHDYPVGEYMHLLVNKVTPVRQIGR